MKERINWIDWGKTLAMVSVVFCHLPQSQEWFYYRYLQALTMVVFIFISGYLKKDRGSDKENWRKYWHGLIIPYIIYNVVVYPYWLVKYYLANGGIPDFLQAMKPLIGALLMEHESSFAEPLNGPLWYLPAILVMHILVDLCRKTRHQHWIMGALCIVSVVLYTANKYWYFAPQLTPIGIMRNLPYYYMGYLMGREKNQGDRSLIHGFAVGIKRPVPLILLSATCLTASILLFAWHLQAFYQGQHILHIVLFYPVNICFLFCVLFGCKLLNSLKSAIIVNLSIGTLVVIGLHIVLVTIINFALEHLLHIDGGICYHWYTALPVVLLIIALLYPIIPWAKRHAPMLIGR